VLANEQEARDAPGGEVASAREGGPKGLVRRSSGPGQVPGLEGQGALPWQPRPNKFLLAYCFFGQVRTNCWSGQVCRASLLTARLTTTHRPLCCPSS